MLTLLDMCKFNNMFIIEVIVIGDGLHYIEFSFLFTYVRRAEYAVLSLVDACGE